MEEIIEENKYQNIKKRMDKKDDYFSKEEIINFTNIHNNFNAIFNATPQIFLDKHK